MVQRIHDRRATHVAHDYTLGDIDNIAAYVTRDSMWLGADRSEVFAAARDGVLDAILARDRPTPGDVFASARAAVNQARRDWRQTFGLRAYGPGVAPQFCAYWADWIRPVGSGSANDGGHADSVIDAVALGQILAGISEQDADLIRTFAATGSRSATATALEISDRKIGRRITRAREEIFGLWHEDETPPRVPPPPRETVPAKCGTRAGYMAHRRHNEHACQDCREVQAAYMRDFNAARAALRGGQP